MKFVNVDNQWIPEDALNIPGLDNFMQNGKDHIQNFVGDHVADPIAHGIEEVIWRVGGDLLKFGLEQAAPVCFVLCMVFILLSIVGVRRAPHRAFVCGVISAIGYSFNWGGIFQQ